MAITKTEFEQETWFTITGYHLMRPFLMNVVSHSNHWMFIVSNGGVTAGRKNPQYALFPYYTDDKLAELAHTTGSKTIFQVSFEGNVHIWEPFSDRCTDKYEISRNLYKNLCGNKILFEEINHHFGLIYRYQWNTGTEFGFIKKAELVNTSGNRYHITLLDGIQNIMPYGIDSSLQMTASNLADAYKRSELVKETGLGIFALSAVIVDKAEPSEALKANIAWSLGLQNNGYLLSSLQVENFRNKQPIQEELDIKGEKGAYFVWANLQLPENGSQKWKIVANVNQNHADIIALNHLIKTAKDLNQLVEQDISEGTKQLLQLVAGADGLQLTADYLNDARHYSNVLFNILRGGTFDWNYQITKTDFADYLQHAGKNVFRENQTFINALKSEFTVYELNNLLEHETDPHLIRLCKEYLPLKFSRRHGDPSRPWNYFSINTYNELDGSKILDYEGNWRDIFQNWEALALAYPDFVEGMMYKFLNASTFDGYNPYRVTKGGFDWEVIEHDNPWSYIGYWGDHQIIYLLKFLEFYDNHRPKALVNLFNSEHFVYANVPYKIKKYSEIRKDPKNTIYFDEIADKTVREKITEYGADGSLLFNNSHEIHRVNFIEKILATVLAKIANFIPEAGIWMNTQRPEWNDANNALVGNGASMVTLYYLRRFLKFFENIISKSGIEFVPVSEELYYFFTGVTTILSQNRTLLKNRFSDHDRNNITNALGQAGSSYRSAVYDLGFSGNKHPLSLGAISGFLQIALQYAEHSIAANRRKDNLYHAYNLITVQENEISVSHLSEMLEGQVAVISSGYLSSEEVLHLLDALRNSLLYRKDQNSYLLYPNKNLPGFLEKNNIPKALVKKSRLLQQLLQDNNRQIINLDVEGNCHFNGNFTNANDLKAALGKLSNTPYRLLAEEEAPLIAEIFEEIFNHKAFTGRSGTFFAYEGLGSIYWHMVSKLHLAVQEACIKAFHEKTDQTVLNRLAAHYDQIAEGIGVHKSPERYGAFPTDPYSHTPLHKGAQQPGMTGQVKEDILVKFAELGVLVQNGAISFNPCLLKKAQFVTRPSTFNYFNVSGQHAHISLLPNSLCFTICQIPVVYSIADTEGVEIAFINGNATTTSTRSLNSEISKQIFSRTNAIHQITVFVRETELR